MSWKKGETRIDNVRVDSVKNRHANAFETKSKSLLHLTRKNVILSNVSHKHLILQIEANRANSSYLAYHAYFHLHSTQTERHVKKTFFSAEVTKKRAPKVVIGRSNDFITAHKC